MDMSRRGSGRPLVGAAVAAGALAAVTALGGCAAVRGAQAGCEGSQDGVRDLAALALLGAHPEGAASPPGFAEPYRGCDDDSSIGIGSGAWLYAGRLYTTAQAPTAVTGFYRGAAAADGWAVKAAPGAGGGPEGSDLCFERSAAGGARTLHLRFMGPDEAREVYGYTLPAGAPPQTIYRVEAAAAADGGTFTCGD
ncbi:hypothetical protein AB0953_13935 [Streptomyces sp. NPDC046866]|uniref:hypothetical protein n=1 Tax=Streptomyces sp. NPDC046866 TaxID=3154921 RepID=UPI003451A74E